MNEGNSFVVHGVQLTKCQFMSLFTRKCPGLFDKLSQNDTKSYGNLNLSLEIKKSEFELPLLQLVMCLG